MPASPISLRLSDDDHALLKELEERTGLIRSGVIKLALRTLRSQLDGKPAAEPVNATKVKQAKTA